jgi:hypothetical protein
LIIADLQFFGNIIFKFLIFVEQEQIYYMPDNAKLDLILAEIQNGNKGLDKINSTLQVIDKRLSLIEQRLENIEKWVPVENEALRYKAA